MPTLSTDSLDVGFARLAGEVAESFSFNKSLGQIYGLLYMSPTPLSLADIGKSLSMSKGNASINVRLLESWGAVTPVSVVGSRKDYYEANRDVQKIVLRRLREGLAKRLNRVEEMLNDLPPPSSKNSDQIKHLQEWHALLAKTRRGLKLVTTWL